MSRLDFQPFPKEMTFRFVTGEGERGTEMAVCGLVPLGAKLELAKRAPIKRIRIETITIRDGLDFLYSPIRAVELRDGNSPVEGDYRRRANRHQQVIKGYYFGPVRIL